VWDRLELPASPVPFAEAKRILGRFGRLRFGRSNEHVVLDPVGATEHDSDLLRRCETAVGRRLFPLGYQEHQDREPIFVDEDGAIYVNFGDDLRLLGRSFEASLRYLARAGAARDFHAVLRKVGMQPKQWSVGEPAVP
jgi:SUKH-3 immunity protein